jgi:hypothetical protein
LLLLDAPAQVRVFVWQRQGRRGAWAPPIPVALREIPEPDEYLQLTAGLIRVRHLGVSAALGDEGLLLWGEIVTAPPR